MQMDFKYIRINNIKFVGARYTKELYIRKTKIILQSILISGTHYICVFGLIVLMPQYNSSYKIPRTCKNYVNP